MRVLVAIFVTAILVMMGLAGYQAALEDAGSNNTVVNETWTPNAGSITVLDDSQLTGAYYSEDVTVYNDTGVEVDEGADYVWFETNGTVKAVSGGALDGEPSATITYSYQLTTQEQRDMTAVLSHIPQAMGTALPVFGVILFLLAFRGAL